MFFELRRETGVPKENPSTTYNFLRQECYPTISVCSSPFSIIAIIIFSSLHTVINTSVLSVITSTQYSNTSGYFCAFFQSLVRSSWFFQLRFITLCLVSFVPKSLLVTHSPKFWSFPSHSMAKGFIRYDWLVGCVIHLGSCWIITSLTFREVVYYHIGIHQALINTEHMNVYFLCIKIKYHLWQNMTLNNSNDWMGFCLNKENNLKLTVSKMTIKWAIQISVCVS